MSHPQPEEMDAGAEATRERAVLFADQMIEAILQGRKTQTRRRVRYKRTADLARIGRGAAGCPFGVPGDRLWVRETWTKDASRVYYRAAQLGSERDVKPVGLRWKPSIHMPRWASRLLLEITEVRLEHLHEISDDGARAEGVRELPLQEGAPGAWWSAGSESDLHGRTPREAFQKLWDSINGGRPWCCWDDNPLVWVITFRLLPSAGAGWPTGTWVQEAAR